LTSAGDRSGIVWACPRSEFRWVVFSVPVSIGNLVAQRSSRHLRQGFEFRFPCRNQVDVGGNTGPSNERMGIACSLLNPNRYCRDSRSSSLGNAEVVSKHVAGGSERS